MHSVSGDHLGPSTMVVNGIRRVFRNTAFILASDVVNRGTTFVLYALVARHLGAFEFGQLSLALTLLYTFQVFAVAGLKTLVTREVAKDRIKTDRYLINGSLVVTLASALSITGLLIFVRLMHYATATASLILLLSLALLPYSLSAICEAVFQAWERMQYIAYANVPVNVAKVSLAFLILSHGYSLYHLILLLLAAHTVTLCLEWWLTLRNITKPVVRIDGHFAVMMTRSTVTFLGIDGIIAIWSSLNILLLSKFAGETEVGLYSSAVQVMMPVTLVFQSIVLSVFPIMCRKFEPTFQGLKRIAEGLIELLLAIALPTAVGLYFLADSALLLLYGEEEFLAASSVLRIMVALLILRALTTALGQVLLAGLREKVTLRIVAVDVVVNLVLGLILISRFGPMGAAIAALITGGVDLVQHYVPVSRLLSNIALGRLAWKPAVAGICMAGYLAALRSQGDLMTAVSAGALYTGILLALAIWSSGGPRPFKARYLYLWSE